MSRLIKFRAWDEEDGMRDWDYVRTSWTLSILKGDRRTTIMQFTGLLDKNGKEIYEGDVLCIENEEVAETIGGFPRYEPDNKIVSVRFDNGTFKTDLGTFEHMQDVYGYQGTYWEIIGNIYENPELLTS